MFRNLIGNLVGMGVAKYLKFKYRDALDKSFGTLFNESVLGGFGEPDDYLKRRLHYLMVANGVDNKLLRDSAIEGAMDAIQEMRNAYNESCKA